MTLKCYRCNAWPCECADGQTIIHGDCREVLHAIAGGSIDAVVSSPPYADQRDYTVPVQWDAIMDALLVMPCCRHDAQVLINLGLVHRDGECICYWEDWRQRMREHGWRFFGWYVWDQGDGLPGDWNGRLAPSHEFVLHFNKSARQPHKWVATKSAGRTISGTGLRRKDGSTPDKQSHSGRDVQAYKIADSVIRIYRQMRRDVQHPAVFPVPLPSALIMSFAPESGTVIDPFLGSGTTLVACKLLGRKGIGIEIEERYCAIAANRLRQGVLDFEEAS